LAAKPDLSEFFKHSRPKKKPCVVGFALDQLGPEEHAQLTAACAEDSGLITNSAIEKWLADRNHIASVSAIVSHRKRTCTCHG
jgi:hypothetical protein